MPLDWLNASTGFWCADSAVRDGDNALPLQYTIEVNSIGRFWYGGDDALAIVCTIPAKSLESAKHACDVWERGMVEQRKRLAIGGAKC